MSLSKLASKVFGAIAPYNKEYDNYSLILFKNLNGMTLGDLKEIYEHLRRLEDLEN